MAAWAILQIMSQKINKNSKKKNYNHVTLVRLQNDPNPLQNSF
jgi:hypothetical protein